MQQLADGWTLDVERGPDWLFVRLHIDDSELALESNLADSLWSLLRQHFVYRLVLELDDIPRIRSHLIGQLVMLHKQVQKHDGLMRLCGLSDESLGILAAANLDRLIPHFRDREEALMGFRPKLPR